MNESLKTVGIGVLGAGVGFVIGYKIAEQRLIKSFDDRLNQQEEMIKEYYTNVKKPYATPEEAVADLIPKKSSDPREPGHRVQYHKVETNEKPLEEFEAVVAEKPEPVVQNVFDDKPFIIDQDSFMQNDPGHQQATLTYYEKSDQVTGERDEPIDNSDIVVGIDFKMKFGEGSSDPNVVHVRNNGLNMDFEIVRSDGSYEEEVLGIADDSVPPHKRHRVEGR